MVGLIGYDLTSLKVDYEKTKEFRINLTSIGEGEKISLMSDAMFHTMFYHQDRIKYSAKFFSYLIDVSYKELLQKLKLAKSELDKDKVYQKGQRCDYVAELDKSILNLEVNTNSSKEVLERNLEYAFRLFKKLSKQGIYNEYLQIIQVNLNNFCFKNNKKSVDIFTLNNDTGDTLSEKIIIINIYLPNIRKKCYTEGVKSLNEFERYILTLCETNIKIAKEMAEEDLFMKDAIEEQKEFCLSEDLRESYNHELAYGEEMKRTGYEEGLECGLERGMEQGTLRGQLDGQKNIINKMLDNGVSLEKISRMINMSVDEINALLNQNISTI